MTYFPKLSEIFILNQARALEARGHEVTFFALSDPEEGIVQRGAQPFLDDSKVSWAQMPRSYWGRLRGAPSRVAQLGVRPALHAVNPRTHGAEGLILTNLYRWSAMRGAHFDFDVAHAQFGSVGRQCVFLRERGVLGRVPLVTAFRGHDLSGYLRYGTSRMYERVFAESGAVMPVAARWSKTLQDLGCPAAKIHPLPSGVPMDRVPRIDAWKKTTPFPRVISAGRLDRYKGLHLGIEAFRQIKRVHPDAHYDIYGDGNEMRALCELVARHGLQNAVTLHGQVSHDVLLDALPTHHLHLFTTVTLRAGRTEGVPNVLKEAQAAGLPSIGFDHPGVSEVIQDGETGWIVPEGNVDAMAARALAVLEDESVAAAMSRRAQTHARSRFDIEQLTTELESIYESVL